MIGVHRPTSRRGFLRGGSIALALPFLEGLAPRALRAASGGARRLVIFHFGNGCHIPDFVPPQVGEGWTPSPILEGIAGHVGAVVGELGADTLANRLAVRPHDPRHDLLRDQVLGRDAGRVGERQRRALHRALDRPPDVDLHDAGAGTEQALGLLGVLFGLGLLQTQLLGHH